MNSHLYEEKVVRQLSQQLLAEVLASDDAAEGVAAFAEKRPPGARVTTLTPPATVRMGMS